MVVLLSLSACGGGGGSTAPTSSNESAAPASTVQTGTIVIEERAGKTVIDAWFASGRSENMGELARDLADDVCRVRVPSSQATSPNTLHTNATISVGIGESMIPLVPNQSDSVTVYTTDERWSKAPVSNDSVIAFDSESAFHELSPVPMSELEPFKWVAPEIGILTNIDEQIRWEPAQSGNTRIEINLSTSDDKASSESAVTVVCNLIDDGEFALSAETQQILGGGETTVLVRGLRVRKQFIESGEAVLNVVQISHEL